MLICGLATDVAYGAIHILSFASIYNTDDNGELVQDLAIAWQDIIIIILYILTNLIYAGCFRILMVHIYWKPWQIILYKLMITLSSILYIALGLMYLFGKNTLNESVESFNNEINDEL
jgi:predicted membrane protein